jgi:hypothetical protein
MEKGQIVLLKNNYEYEEKYIVALKTIIQNLEMQGC